jgi:YegS/Rv2252/BmrU family lipid kinase
MPETLIILNPAAGSGRGEAQWPLVEHELRAAGIGFDLARTSAPGEASRLAEQAASRYSTIAAAGGDGTLHEVAGGLLRASGERETTPLALLPLGTGDDFAKMIPPLTPVGGVARDWRAFVGKLQQGKTQLFDAGRLTADGPKEGADPGPEYFINSVDVGFGPSVRKNLARTPKGLSGSNRYLLAVLTTLLKYSSPTLKIQLDDQAPVEQPSTLTAIGNGRSFGAGYWFAPEAQADDGLLDVLIAPKLGRLAILGLMPKIMKGTHTREGQVRMGRARRIVLDSRDPLGIIVDGEMPYTGARHVEVEVLSQVLPIVV